MRLPDWPERLAEFFESRRKAAFSWGQNDCCLFAADAVLAVTGEDPAKGRRTYSTERGAARVIAKAGGMRDLVPYQDKPVGFAQRGDVVLAEQDGRQTLGVVAGNGMYAAPGAEGIVFRPMSEAIAAFEI